MKGKAQLYLYPFRPGESTIVSLESAHKKKANFDEELQENLAYHDQAICLGVSILFENCISTVRIAQCQA